VTATGQAPAWSGRWVAERLDVALTTTSSPVGLDLPDLVGLALRRNPRRAHLLVSRVLGKHVPTDPRVVHGSGLLLGLLVREALAGDVGTHDHLGTLLRAALASGAGADAATFRAAVAESLAAAAAPRPAPLVLGYAETAVSLGHSVARAIPGAGYLHSTRREVVGSTPVGGFEEEHSHATSHLLLPADAALLAGDDASRHPLVLVDDELSTGTTVRNTVTALHRLAPRERYVVAALVDLRSADDEERLAAHAADLGTRVDVVALVRGGVELPADVLARGAALVADAVAAAPVTHRARRAETLVAPARWPHDLPEGGRHGLDADALPRVDDAAAALAGDLAAVAGTGEGAVVHVLGTEEQMAVPLLVAEALADAHPGATVRYSTTTRSPALAVDEDGYALRQALTFAGPEDGQPRFAYNTPCADDADVVVVTDDPAAGPGLHADGGLLDALSSHPRTRRTLVASLPTVVPALPTALHGPGFGSYRADEVSWLLTDLSHVELEAPTAEREREIQSGRAHYAESLPIEFQPDPAYYELFHASVRESAARIAHAVGVVSEILLAERGGDRPERLVLASLARAGTPVGVLMRRWFQRFHGLDVPHHAVSIVRGRGIDALALRYLAEHHDPAGVVFVDGWTGKGAIARELTAALDLHADRTGVRFDDALAVLADPGSCVTTYGTRDDFLIPSACLNSTVSGLVSRTVLNDELIGPGDFHGAKFYAELAGADVSNEYLDAVTDRFDEVRDRVADDWRAVAASDRTPTWAGWAAVERISEDYGIGQVNLVKPGVGETTRVLLRRVPERVLVRPGAAPDLPHVLALARARGVPVEEVEGLAYSCVGLIDPTAGGEG
jgi:adenine/guanine phosphoribosyltransferase-like PRPP-binding protein